MLGSWFGRFASASLTAKAIAVATFVAACGATGIAIATTSDSHAGPARQPMVITPAATDSSADSPGSAAAQTTGRSESSEPSEDGTAEPSTADQGDQNKRDDAETEPSDGSEKSSAPETDRPELSSDDRPVRVLALESGSSRR